MTTTYESIDHASTSADNDDDAYTAIQKPVLTTTYESLGPSSTPADDGAYTPIQKPDHDYEDVDAVEPVKSDYLVLTP